MLDSLESGDGENIRAIEADLFQQKFKDRTTWEGSMEENREANQKIASAVRSSLTYQEKYGD